MININIKITVLLFLTRRMFGAFYMRVYDIPSYLPTKNLGYL